MTLRIIILLAAVALLDTSAAPANEAAESEKSVAEPLALDEKDDLKTAASSGYAGDRYSDWNRYPSSQGVTGYGSIDSRYNYGGLGAYDNSYGNTGYDGGYPRYSGGGYGSSGYSGYAGNSGYSGYSGNSGYNGYKGGYSGGYGFEGGNGGYGGYAGNGGLSSYYGYNNPYYQGANHLSYGYYRRPGYGNIYNSGITPSLVTGYRGYSK